MSKGMSYCVSCNDVWPDEDIDDKCYCPNCYEVRQKDEMIDKKLAQIKSLQDSIINACGRVIAETEHKPVNASELADLVVKSEMRENDIIARADMADLFKEDRIGELEEQLAEEKLLRETDKLNQCYTEAGNHDRITELESINKEYVDVIADLVNEINNKQNQSDTIANLREYCQTRWGDYFANGEH